MTILLSYKDCVLKCSKLPHPTVSFTPHSTHQHHLGLDLAVSVAIEGEGEGTAVCDFHRGLLELLHHGIKLFVNSRLQLNLKYIDLVLMLVW